VTFDIVAVREPLHLMEFMLKDAPVQIAGETDVESA
jgi:hypothetical protein